MNNKLENTERDDEELVYKQRQQRAMSRLKDIAALLFTEPALRAVRKT